MFDEPSAVRTVTAITINGSARIASTMRLITSSVMPPKNPVIRPMIVPKTIAIRVAAGATRSDDWAPARTREKMSRPNWSVPNQYVELGALRIASVCSSGSCGVNADPVIAQNTQKRMIRQPTMNVLERRSCRIISRRAILASLGTSPAAGSKPAASSVIALIRHLQTEPAD